MGHRGAFPLKKIFTSCIEAEQREDSIMFKHTKPLLTAVLIASLASPASAFQRGGRGGGGFRGGGGGFRSGGFGGYRGGYAPGAMTRTPSVGAPRTRQTPVGNINRFNAPGNLNRFNPNVANRTGWGWRNPYWGSHQGWVRGHWFGGYPGAWGGGFWPGAGWGLGLGLGFGLSSWVFGPMLYNWGYAPYSNPYYGGYGGNAVVASQPAIYDYSQPLDTQNEPPAADVMSQANTSFDSAREAFRAGDYTRALDLVDQALRQTPNDPTLHEFRALILFALKRYDEAAVPLYAVLSVGPGWDWDTLISLYADPETYTQQIHALEDYAVKNSQSPQARLVLAYHYMTEGHTDAATRQFKSVVTLEPKDQLAPQLIQLLEKRQAQPAAGTESAPAPTPPAPSPTPPPATSAPSGKEGRLEGTWTAQPAPDTTITLSFQDQGRFLWKVSRKGKDQQFSGKFTHENGVLTLVQDQNNNNVMVGNVSWKDDSHFGFKVVGSGPGDPGLSLSSSK
jgi:tetratricopeptide (TPR) repeat protein